MKKVIFLILTALSFSYGAFSVTTITDSISILGGDTVSIVGTDLTTNGVVFFYNVETPEYISRTDLLYKVISPAHARGSIPVYLISGNNDLGWENIWYYQPVTVTSHKTLTGDIGGGDKDTISGTGFLASQGTGSVTYGGETATINSWSATSIAITTPAHAVGAVSIIVTNDDLKSDTLTTAFTYRTEDADSLNPTSGTDLGGTSVRIRGTHFLASQGTGTVLFGATEAASYTSWDDTLIVVVSPAHARGAVTVTITNNNAQEQTLSYTYFTIPILANNKVSKCDTSALVKDTITLTGGLATQSTGTVTYGGTAATVESWSDIKICTIVPHHVAGVVDLVVMNSDSKKDTLSGALDYTIVPVIDSVNPATGVSTGGSVFRIRGHGFIFPEGNGYVKFGTTSAASYAIWNDSTIQVTTPAHVSGAVDVIVKNDSTMYDTSVSGFTYYCQPVITSQYRTTCDTTGGCIDTIKGTGFGSPQGDGFVKYGTTSASITSWSDIKIICTVPAHARGAVNVIVQSSDDVSDTGTLTYTVIPRIDAIYPARGSVNGTYKDTILGLYFGVNATVTYGGTAATYFLRTDDSLITIVPAHTSGPVNVIVTNQYGNKDTTSFTYDTLPYFTSQSRNHGLAAGGYKDTIHGSGLATMDTVYFGTEKATVFSNTATKVIVTVPAGDLGAVVVRGVNNAGDTCSLSETFEYSNLRGLDYTPKRARAGSKIYFTAEYGLGTSGLEIKFGGQSATIDAGYTDTRATATLPDSLDVQVISTSGDSTITFTKGMQIRKRKAH